MKQAIASFSGGLSSWLAAKRAKVKYGNVTLLFADTLIEDPDLYRFMDEAAANIGEPIVRLVEGRTPWEVFRDVKYIGNSRIDPCSRILKREQLDRWHALNCDPADTVIIMGYNFSEAHRLERTQAHNPEWTYEAPLLESPWLTPAQMIQAALDAGIQPPRLYSFGFAHNNCGGTCVKAGQAQWALVLKHLPERYAEWEREENAFRERRGKNVAILRDRTGGMVKPLPLTEFRERLESKQQYDMLDWGSCGCFSGSE